MRKPTQEQIETCRAVLDYCIADCQQNEPYAVSTIATWEEAVSCIPNEDELGDID